VEGLLLIIAGIVAWLYIKGQGTAGGASNPQALPANPSTSAAGYSPFSALADAWANAEGFFKPGSLAQRNNNPVNLKGTGWPGQTGSTPQGFAVFSDEAYGFDAAQSYLAKQATAHPDWTLKNLFAKILGNTQGQPVNNDQGNSDQEAQNVANYLGISSGTSLSDYESWNAQ
jgi:hypothetical protein